MWAALPKVVEWQQLDVMNVKHASAARQMLSGNGKAAIGGADHMTCGSSTPSWPVIEREPYFVQPHQMTTD